jgi:hypothetical protein
MKFMQECFDNARRDGNHSLAISCHRIIRRIYYGLGQYTKWQELLGAEIITHTEQVLGKAGVLDIQTEMGMNKVMMGDVYAGLQILE